MGTIPEKNTVNNGTRITRIRQIVTDFYKNSSATIRPIRVIRVPLLAPFLLALSTVFVINDDLANGVVSGKYFWFYSSMGLVSLATLIQTLIDRRSFRVSLQDILVLLFVATVYLSALLSNSASVNTTRLTILTLLVVLYFSFRLIINTFNRKDMVLPAFCLFIILTGLVEAVWGLRQLYGFESSQHNLFKLTGSFFNPGPYAGYLAVVFPLALLYALRLSPIVLRLISAIACIAILLVLPAAMSRASWLAVVAGSAVVVYEGLRVKPAMTKRMKWIAGIVVVLLLLSASVGMYFLKKDSADGRALTWKISLQTVAKHPFGVGLGNFPSAYGETQAAYFASGQATETEQLVAGNPEYGFNEYLQIAVESGIIALVIFMVIIISTFRSMLQAKSWGMMGSFVSLSVFSAFSYPFSVLPFLIVFVFLLAASSVQWNTDNTGRTDLYGFSPSGSNYLKISGYPPHPCHLRSIVLAFLCLLVTAFCLYKQYPVYKAYRQWKTSQIYYHAGLFKDTAKSYEALYPYLNDQIRFLFEYAQCLSKSGQPEKSNEVLLRATQISCDPMLYNIMGKNYQIMKQYEQAETVFIKATQLVPSRLYPWYLLTKLYHAMGLQEKVDETAKIVETKEPKVQSPAVREMREEVRELRVKN
ncbi:MAG: O-antigen ligase family protein [Prevotellaceae bacterium]|jgi:O-antigen ligase|nr:O-antigen ligase family protein [Prevotellaceae bacterium]